MSERTPTPVLIERMLALADEFEACYGKWYAIEIRESAQRLSDLHVMVEKSHGAVIYFFEVALKDAKRQPNHWVHELLAQFDQELAK